MDFIASNISSSDIFTGQEPKAVLRTSLFNGLHPLKGASTAAIWVFGHLGDGFAACTVIGINLFHWDNPILNIIYTTS
jgi:hypothetical protein